MIEIAYIDHYDSFSDNLIDWLVASGLVVKRIFSDDLIAIEALAAKPVPVVLSPGPNSPNDSPASIGLVAAVFGRVPILGVCLGHQIINVAKGGRVMRSSFQGHGVTKAITVKRHYAGLFCKKIRFDVGVYNSLTVTEVNGDCFETVGLDQFGEVQIVRSRPDRALWEAWGLQFHPESFLTEDLWRFQRYWCLLVKGYFQACHDASSTISSMSCS